MARTMPGCLILQTATVVASDSWVERLVCPGYCATADAMEELVEEAGVDDTYLRRRFTRGKPEHEPLKGMGW